MLDPADQEKIQTTVKTYWGIYLSIVVSCVMYIFVTYIVTSSGTPRETSPAIFRSLLIVLSIVAGAGKFWVLRMQADEERYLQCGDIDDIIKKFGSYLFISMALCQIPAMFGLIMVFLTMRMGEWAVFLVIGAYLFATATPRSSVLENMVEAHNARNPAEEG
jgi:putative effector of murein hydrolase LrgA (UPF0299 family)